MWQYSRRNFEDRFASVKETFPRLRTVPYRRRKTLAKHVDNAGKKEINADLGGESVRKRLLGKQRRS